MGRGPRVWLHTQGSTLDPTPFGYRASLDSNQTIYNGHRVSQGSPTIGHPGAGKTILAAAVVEELQNSCDSHPSPPDVYYYFFDHQFPSSTQSAQASRSIIAQLLWENRYDSRLLDRLTFVVEESGQGQLTA
jgi:Cdc6-like AAA superfamily ATPase